MNDFEKIATAALQGLLANPSLINTENIHLSSPQNSSETLALIAYRAVIAAMQLKQELSIYQDSLEEGKRSRENEITLLIDQTHFPFPMFSPRFNLGQLVRSTLHLNDQLEAVQGPITGIRSAGNTWEYEIKDGDTFINCEEQFLESQE